MRNSRLVRVLFAVIMVGCASFAGADPDGLGGGGLRIQAAAPSAGT